MTNSITDYQNIDIPLEIQKSTFVLNKLAYKVEDKKALEEQLAQLKFQGVSTPYSEKNKTIKQFKYQNIYLVAIFQQKILGIYKQVKQNKDNWINSSLFKSEPNNIYAKTSKLSSKREERRIKRLATRAVYALNLDYALVKIGTTTGATPWVLYVNSYPETNPELTELFEKEIDFFTEKWNQNLGDWKKNAVLGTDPEFILQGRQGKLVLASKYLPKNGVAGCDQIWVNQDRTQLPLAELRPAPSSDPRELVINIYKSMVIASKRIKDLEIKWLAGALPTPGYPLGGHIHFSKVWLNSFFLRALDNYLTLIISLFEDKNGRGRRPKYGFLGDYREQFHGGFEYRTLPSWLISPRLAKGVIALSKLIADNYIYLEQNPLEQEAVQRAYYSGDKEILRPIVKELWIELKELKDFSLYEKYLMPLEGLINNGYSWNESDDIRSEWLLPPYHKQKKS